ncbi:MAG TPA: 50S ribosomal protein L24 [Spirochaetota bacterium]|nr:50S ribosomal protein L24 [Spirochaetota bacterium]HQP48055.1 50S ribosomal protein L24 [Spirochaetota bacterium]
MNKSIIKKNDSVVVVYGKDRGSRGKVLFVDTKRNRVVVEGVNKKKKYLKPSNENPKGGVISIEYPINLSNVMVFCEKCKKAVRLGMNINGEKKVRVCKKCNKTLD